MSHFPIIRLQSLFWGKYLLLAELCILGILGALGLPRYTLALTPPDDNLDHITILTAPEVRYMMEVEKSAILIHNLSKLEYDIQHIPGSINIPVTEMETTTDLPPDKNARIIFYCMGPECDYSKKAAQIAVQHGYTNIYWFRGGIPEWHRFNYPMVIDTTLTQNNTNRLNPDKVAELIAQYNPVILDVRPLFWKGSKAALKGSTFIPLVELHKRYTSLPKNRKIIVVDAYMKQSPNAARFLISQGYDVLGVLKGGFVRWEKEGYPIVQFTPPAE